MATIPATTIVDLTSSSRSYWESIGPGGFLIFPLWLTLPLGLAGQQTSAQRETASPIQDNSFLIEEAYNQERSVVQHINTFSRAMDGTAWDYSFTQEWPVRVQRHQASYTVPIVHSARANGARTGLGDIALNYRYQWLGIGGGPAFAPRLTLMLPTGASRRGFGAGGATLQMNLPFSIRLPASVVAHTNAGMSFTPRARDSTGAVSSAREYSAGQSFVWLAHQRLNFMLEAKWTAAEEVIGHRMTGWTREFLVAPGIRGAIDFPSGLQIVPGLAVPIGVGPSRGERHFFAYLSFEHPFGVPD